MTQSPARAAFYRAVWRWHFYAGLYVIPFFIMLATTGMAMLWIAWLDGRDGERHMVTPQAQPLALSEQAESAQKAFPNGALAQYIAPRSDDLAAIFRLNTDSGPMMAVIDPYNAEILEVFPRRSGWYDLMDNLHGSLLLGLTGDRMIEIAASLGILLLVTGLYLWWPRDTSLIRALTPRVTGGGRGLWKSLHSVIGIYISLFLLFFLISGLAWAGVWGEKMIQAWSSFPVGKYDAIPLSDTTHAETLNGGRKEVPWALEQTPMPASDAHAGHSHGSAPATATPSGITAGPLPNLDQIDAFARDIGFSGRYQLNLPQGDTGVWTLSRDSMSTDSLDPTSDRITHIDRYSGAVLADIRYGDYSLLGKAMAVGIALHMGTLGLWSVLANTLICLSVLFICLSGIILWWKRRPTASWQLSPPPLPRNMPHWPAATGIVLLLGLAFPMAGITIALVLIWDALLRPRLLRRTLA